MKRFCALCFVCLFCLVSCGSAPDLTIGGHDWTVQTITMTEEDASVVMYCAPELAEQYPETVMTYYTYRFFPHPDGIENTFLLQSLYQPSPEYEDYDHSICTFTLIETEKDHADYALQVTGDEGDGITLDGNAVVSLQYEDGKPICYTLQLIINDADAAMTVHLTAPYTE
ncbi:MAG: hypothetical protein IKV57_06585 [Clostridia bacterium]|nr:hypothetical protein [Clostridia bacterium]